MSHRISRCSAQAFALTLPFSLGHEITVVAPRYYSYKYCKLHIWATFSIVFQHKPDRYLFKGKPIAPHVIYSSIFKDLLLRCFSFFSSLFHYPQVFFFPLSPLEGKEATRSAIKTAFLQFWHFWTLWVKNKLEQPIIKLLTKIFWVLKGECCFTVLQGLNY